MVWQADLGNGRYRNPILYTDYSDPDAIRVGEDYYMTASSFCNAPGLPILHSWDLVNWKLINYGLERIPEFRYRDPIHGCGVWAPAIRYHAGRYYICFPMPDEGLYMITAEDPAGRWSEPVKLYDGAGYIDPCPFWDEDGKAYLVCGVAKSRIGYKSVLYLWEMRPDGLGLIGEPVKVYDGTPDGNTTTEGPKLYKKYGYYYIFAPAGGVKTGWQIVLRSRKIYGPYEVRTVMRQGSTGINGPHQGAWVEAADGSDWFLHFQDVFAAGRIVHLQPMSWTEEHWPVIGAAAPEETECGQPVLEWSKPAGGEVIGKKSTMENHFSCGLPVNSPWQWNANPDRGWLLSYEEEGTKKNGGEQGELSNPQEAFFGEITTVSEENGVEEESVSKETVAEKEPVTEAIGMDNTFAYDETGQKMQTKVKKNSAKKVTASDDLLTENIDRSGSGRNDHASLPDTEKTGHTEKEAIHYTITTEGEAPIHIGLVATEVSAKRPLADYPSLLLRKWEAPEFTVSCRIGAQALQEGEMAGMVSLGTHYAAVVVRRRDGRLEYGTVEGQQHFDRGMVYVGEEKDFGGEISAEKDEICIKMRVKNENNVSAYSKKPEYKEGDEGIVLHPEELINMVLEDRTGRKYKEISIPAKAGRWVGVKYGVFRVRIIP